MKQIKNLLRELKVLEGPFRDFPINNLPDNPIDLFIEWLKIAINEGIYEPHKMILSTVDRTGRPDARVLILKNAAENKWYFATSETSRKGEQLQLNSNVALTFYWPELGRQVRICGEALKMPNESNTADFLERSSSARAVALLGNQSRKLAERKELDDALVITKELVKRVPDTVSTDWSLYGVEAREVEFWQGDSERKHTRVQYQQNNGLWEHHLLWP
jgi:pyridoxamine 5'-phosphate oxidase